MTKQETGTLMKRSKKTIDGKRCNVYVVGDAWYLTKDEAYAALGTSKPARSDKKPVARRNIIAVADATLKMHDVVLAWAYSDDFQLKHYNLMNDYLEGRSRGYAGLKTMQRAGTVLSAVNEATAHYKQYNARKDKRYMDDSLYLNPTWCEDRDWIDAEPLDALALEIDAMLDARHNEWLKHEPKPELSKKEYERSILSNDSTTYIHSKDAVVEYEEIKETTKGATARQVKWSQGELYEWMQQQRR